MKKIVLAMCFLIITLIIIIHTENMSVWWNELSTFWQTSIVTIVTASLTAILTSFGALCLQYQQNKKEDERQKDYFTKQLTLNNVEKIFLLQKKSQVISIYLKWCATMYK